MHIADGLELVQSLSPQLRPQQAIYTHTAAGGDGLCEFNGPLSHPARLDDLIHNAVLERLLGRPLVRLEQHFPRNLRVQLQPRQSADAVKVQSQVHGRHADEATLAVHDPVVARQAEGARASKGVARDQSDGRVGVVHQRREQRVEPVGVGVDVGVGLVELQARAPELVREAGDDDRAWRAGLHQLHFDVPQCGDDALGKGDIQAVLGWLVQHYDVDPRC